MRTSLTVAIIFLSTSWLFGQTPLTVQEIDLMLRSGYSSETILGDLSARHFAGRLDSSAEKKLREANASPVLLDALRSGSNAASVEQLARLRHEQRNASRSRNPDRNAASNLSPTILPSGDIVNYAPAATASPSKRPEIIIAPMPKQKPLYKSRADELAAEKREAATRAAEAERAAYEAWCAGHPVECAQKEAEERARRQAKEEAEDAQRRRAVADAEQEGEAKMKRKVEDATRDAEAKQRQKVEEAKSNAYSEAYRLTYSQRDEFARRSAEQAKEDTEREKQRAIDDAKRDAEREKQRAIDEARMRGH